MALAARDAGRSHICCSGGERFGSGRGRRNLCDFCGDAGGSGGLFNGAALSGTCAIQLGRRASLLWSLRHRLRGGERTGVCQARRCSGRVPSHPDMFNRNEHAGKAIGYLT